MNRQDKRSLLAGVGKGLAIMLGFLAPAQLLCVALVANERYIACGQLIMLAMALGGFFATRRQASAPLLNGSLSVLLAYAVYTLFLIAFDGILHEVHVPSLGLGPDSLLYVIPGLAAVFLARAVFARRWKES